METTKKEELTRVKREDDKYNFITANGKLLSDKWFEWAEDFENGLARVQRFDDLMNFITANGKLLSEKWFEWADYFENGFARVKREGGFFPNSKSIS